MNPALNSVAKPHQKKKGFISSSNLILIAYATAFFPRVLIMAKFPSAINFLHFLAVPYACGLVLFKAKITDRNQYATSQALLFGLMLLLTVCFASALLNDAGVINAVLSFLLLAEPFMLVLAIIFIPFSPESFQRFQKWALGFPLFNVAFSLVQKFILKWDTCYCAPGGWATGDAIKGVFINQGSGHVVGASVSASIGIYYFGILKHRPLWERTLVCLAGLSVIQWSQTNQVVVVMAGGFVLLSLTNMKDIGKAIAYLIGTAIFAIGFYWAIENVEAFSTFKTWIRPEIYGPDGAATQLKISSLRVVVENFFSPLNWFLGLGPGHTVGRLGGWMLKDFSELLTPLGATRAPQGISPPVGDQVWMVVAKTYLDSSFFSPFWGWAAIWGDIGFLGLFAYLYCCFILWKRICPDDVTKYLILTVAIHGLIFTQMEEPGYMLFIASLIGLRWQEKRIEKMVEVKA